jgi:glycosyltransferase involved in cell wall biosynthesis
MPRDPEAQPTTAICMLVQNYYEIDVRVRRKAEALVDAGYRVDVLALRSPGMQEASYTLKGVNVRTLALGKERGTLVRYAFEYAAFFVWAAFALASSMRRQRYAVVEVNTLPDFLVFAAAPAKWMGARVVLDMHEITPEFYMSKYGMRRESLAVRALTLIERMSMRFADRVLVINQPIEDLLVDRGLDRAKSVIVMNAVDEALFEAETFAARDDGRQRPRWVMMYHGTLTRIYGLDIAIEAFEKAQAEMPGAELWILGGGPEKERLIALARRLSLESRVRFMGSVLPQEIPGWLHVCDIGVLPTRRDVFLDFSFSNKLSEYIVTGKGAIVSRLNAIRHYFSEEALVYFEPNDAADLAAQMIRTYRDPQLTARIARQAQDEYRPIRWGVMKERYLATMHQLAAPHADRVVAR